GRVVGDQGPELIVEILFDRRTQIVARDAAGGHHLRRMLVVDQRDQQMFEGRILVPALAGLPQRIMEGLFEFASKTRHLDDYSPPSGSQRALKTMSYGKTAQSRAGSRLFPSLAFRDYLFGRSTVDQPITSGGDGGATKPGARRL